MKKISFYLLSFTIFFYCAKAQNNTLGNVSISSPTAAALGKYGDYPVSYHTGVPQISIPIYTVKEGNLSLPISLSYHASGLKVQEAASWVGAGWSLNAGGVITRTVIGAPDDRGYLTNTTHGHFSDYGYNNYLFNNSQGYSSTDCYSYPEQNMGLIDDGGFDRGEKDGEPDLFFFNFNGYSGKFYFNDDRTPVLLPEQDLKIEPILQNLDFNIIGFIITTQDGTKYYFGKNQNLDGNIDGIEKTTPYTLTNGLNSGSINSSWYLTKIESADNQFNIKLSYQPEKYSYYTISMFPVADDDLLNKHFSLVKNYIDGVSLKQINFSNGKVNFLSSEVRTDLGEYATKTLNDLVNTDSKMLGTIQITNNENSCKNFILTHSYFVDNTTALTNALTGGLTLTTDTKRLKLDAIQEIACDNSQTSPPYSFTYTTPTGSFLPRRLTFALDHWGYYNGKTNNIGLLPTYTVNDFDEYVGADRESSWPEIGYGTLNKITYPTGGYTNFVFEPNDIWANYNYYNPTSVKTGSIGPYVGNPYNQQIDITTTSNSYKFVLDFHTNPYGNSTGSASIAGISVDKNTLHKEITIRPGSGFHTYFLSQNNMSSNTSDWASLTIYEQVPTSFQNNKIIGGIRIKSISSSEGNTGNIITTNYNYKSGAQSTGILYSRPTYVQVLRNEILRQIGYAADVSNSCSPSGCLNCDVATSYQKSPSSLRPMETVQGNHIGYNYVEVSQNGNGKSIYSYYGSNIWDQNQNDVSIKNVYINSCPLTIPNYPAAPLPFEFKRGELKYEANYNESGILLKSIYYYPEFTNNPKTTPAYLSQRKQITLYNLFTAKKTKETVTSNVYEPSGNIITTTETLFFESPYHHQVTKKLAVNSMGQNLETRIKYSFDFRIPTCEAISDCYLDYNTSYTNALNTFNYKINTCFNNGCNCKFPAFQSYRYWWSVARKNFILCRKNNFTDPVNAFKTAHDNAKAGANTDLKPILELQDSYINVPIETTSWKNGLLTGGVFNQYDYALNPSNKVYLTQNQILSINSPSNTFSPTVVNSNGTALIKDSRYEIDNKLKFLFGNLSEVTPRNGVTKSYLYGYNKNLPIAQVINAKSNELFHENFEEAAAWQNFAPILDYTKSHTGKASGKIVNPTGGEYVSHAPAWLDVTIPTPTKYKFSGWIYSNGPSAEIYFFMKYDKNSGSYFDYVTSNITFTINQWVYIEGEYAVPAGITALQLRIDNNGGGTVWFDDLRIYPSVAQMTTYTYAPLIGITSQTDPNNRTTYYEYDGLNRLMLIKDQDNNILKKYCYNYQGQTTNCQLFSNQVISGTYYSQNCQSGQTPQPLSVNVPAGQYYSTVSQADANSQAQQYAQSYANQNGTCVSQNVTLNYQNNTSTFGTSIQLYNTATAQSYNFQISPGSGILGTIPAGTYNIEINSTNYFNYSVGCGYYASGSGITSFYGVPISSGCNLIQVY